MADLGFFDSSGNKISQAESERRFPKSSSSSSSSSNDEVVQTFEVTNKEGETFTRTQTRSGSVSDNGEQVAKVSGNFLEKIPSQKIQRTTGEQATLPTSRTSSSLNTPFAPTRENAQRLQEQQARTRTISPNISNALQIATERNLRDANVRKIIQSEINKPFKPDAQEVGRVVKASKEEKFPNKVDESFSKGFARGIGLTRDVFNPPFIRNSKPVKFAKTLPGKASQKLSKEISIQDTISRREAGGNSVLSEVRAFGAGATKGLVDVADLVINADTKVIPPLAFAAANPRETFRAIDAGLATSGDKIKTASVGTQGVFAGEVIAGAGIENTLLRNVIAPARNIISARVRGDFIPLTSKAVTREVSVKPFERTRTTFIKEGDNIPKDFVLKSDDILVTREQVKGFTRNIKTGETQPIIEQVPTSKAPVNVNIVGNTASNERTLSEQISFAGTETNAVSAQRGLIQNPENVFSFLTNKKTINIDKPNPNPIEQSLFFSPSGELRTSRFGVDAARNPSLMDLATENLNPRSEIIIKPQTKIADFPKDLQPAVKFLISEGKQLPGESVGEAVGRVRSQTQKKFPGFEQKVTEFQLRTKGELTAPGFFSREAEVIASSGQDATFERIGTTLISNRKVKIFEETGLSPKPVAESRIKSLSRDAAFVDAAADSFFNSLISSSSRPAPKVFNPRSRTGITTSSLTGLETPSARSDALTSSSSVIGRSRGFVPPAPLESPSARVTREPIRSAPIIVISSRPPARNRREPSSPIISSPSSPIVSAPSSIIDSPRAPRRAPASSRTPPRRTTRGTPFTTLSPFKAPRLKSSRGTSSFTTQVLKKGKFQSIGRSETKTKAFNLGSRAVGSSADRTFRIIKGGSPISLQGNSRFRRSKSKPFSVVEKNKFAINTPGEVFEIPGAKKRKRRSVLR